MLRIFALTADGELHHLTYHGWEHFTGGLHQRPIEFVSASEAREYLSGAKIRWPLDTVDRYIGDALGGVFLSTHEIEPFEAAE